MFVYLSGSEKGKTRIFTQNHVTIGTSDACDLKLVPEEGGTLPDGVIADVYDDDGHFHMMQGLELEPVEIKINGEDAGGDPRDAAHVLHDGDTIHFGHGLSSASVLFQVMPENFAAAPLAVRNQREIEPAAAQPVHPLTATLFVKELTASLWAEVPRRVKLIGMLTTAAVILAVVGSAFFVILTVHRNTNETERLREMVTDQQSTRERDQETIRNQQEEIAQLREQGEQLQLFTQKIANQYNPGVCLIVGSYRFVERGSGRALRYETADGASDSPVDQNGNLLASVDGAGPPVQIDYTGTGFVVEKGVIATNRHVAQPWATDSIAQLVMSQGSGFRPRLEALSAFFPSIQTPFELRLLEASDRYDIALCRFDQGDAALPVLPLSTADPRTIIGLPIVLLGYPTGIDGLLQRVDESERSEILKQRGLSAVDIAAGLASRGLIRPLTTTGTISDALPGRIVHSAQTTEGGSGSPMFDREGHVIAINSAILATTDGNQSFGGSNFGVPIRATYDMLLAYHTRQGKD